MCFFEVVGNHSMRMTLNSPKTVTKIKHTLNRVQVLLVLRLKLIRLDFHLA